MRPVEALATIRALQSAARDGAQLNVEQVRGRESARRASSGRLVSPSARLRPGCGRDRRDGRAPRMLLEVDLARDPHAIGADADRTRGGARRRAPVTGARGGAAGRRRARCSGSRARSWSADGLPIGDLHLAAFRPESSPPTRRARARRAAPAAGWRAPPRCPARSSPPGSPRAARRDAQLVAERALPVARPRIARIADDRDAAQALPGAHREAQVAPEPEIALLRAVEPGRNPPARRSRSRRARPQNDAPDHATPDHTTPVIRPCLDS